MSNVKQAFGGVTAITCTLASLASSATVGRESASVDNSSNLWLDALAQVQIKTGAGAVGNDKAVYIYVAASVDGSTWSDTATGADAGITINNPTQLRLGAVISVAAAATTYIAEPFSIAALFGGSMPYKWSLVVINFAGQALDSTEGSHVKQYNGVYQTIV
jgi:hypothetical protein